jgi:hypothetical protein
LSLCAATRPFYTGSTNIFGTSIFGPTKRPNPRWEGQPASSAAQPAAGQKTVYLFNLTADPAELNNLAAARPQTIQQLGKLLLQAHAEAVPPTSTQANPAADAFAVAHNRTIAPWADGNAAVSEV